MRHVGAGQPAGRHHEDVQRGTRVEPRSLLHNQGVAKLVHIHLCDAWADLFQARGHGLADKVACLFHHGTWLFLYMGKHQRNALLFADFMNIL